MISYIFKMLNNSFTQLSVFLLLTTKLKVKYFFKCGIVFIDHSGKEKTDSLQWEEVLSTLNSIRSQLGEVSAGSTKYGSFQKYHDDTFKHKRKEVNPNATFKTPVTFGQNYGFYKFTERDLNDIRYPKKKCEETKYAESIIMTGKQFMK
jgi:hypothetical protein